MAQIFYTACIESGPHNYSVFFPDLPGCVTVGDTVQEAAAHAAEALAVHVAGMLEDGEALPAPSAPDAPLPDWAQGGDGEIMARVLVPAPLAASSRVVRANITIDEGLLHQIDAAAESEGSTRSGFIARLARTALGSNAAANGRGGTRQRRRMSSGSAAVASDVLALSQIAGDPRKSGIAAAIAIAGEQSQSLDFLKPRRSGGSACVFDTIPIKPAE